MKAAPATHTLGGKELLAASPPDLAIRTTDGDREWLVANRCGSFALGNVDRIPRRKYHSLLTVREPPFGEPLNAVSDFAERVHVQGAAYTLAGPMEPNEGRSERASLLEFSFDDVPVWVYRAGELLVKRELRLARETDGVEVRYEFSGAGGPVTLEVRPLLLFRPLHGLTFKNPVLDGRVEREAVGVSLVPYAGLPKLYLELEGVKSAFQVQGRWHDLAHEWERERGYDHLENAFSPGIFSVEITRGDTACVWAGVRPRASVSDAELSAHRAAPADLTPFVATLDRAADCFLVRPGRERAGVIAGYPWFGEWCRDTLISLPGLCLARGYRETALEILESVVSGLERGLVPNIARSSSGPPNLDAVDASLLFVRCVEDLWSPECEARVHALGRVACGVVTALADGADPRVKLLEDGLLFISKGPWALTWMDARVGGEAVTPRHGYPVDINALFLSALAFLLETAAVDDTEFRSRFEPVLSKGTDTFRRLFWSEELGYLADSHDGRTPDFSLRPNQLWAICLPFSPVDARAGLSIIDAVSRHLLTPVGLRTLSPEDPKYIGVYEGDQRARDRAYHQGAVWPWLLGLYAGALSRLGQKERLRSELTPVLERLARHVEEEACIGQVSELFDGDAPHRPRGAPAQAWSVAEVLRAATLVGS